jgi:hypothetical protein
MIALLQKMFRPSPDWRVHVQRTSDSAIKSEMVMRRWNNGGWEYRKPTPQERAKWEAEMDYMCDTAW